ncbi:toll/interleukin-1 receptor domain-containing protein, partial [uncultured Thiohalocapsa sp.]|uniref:toll/interleukin-1 receptor domain-containing protein n=1 Tax=uncultured Thiohalocapsa sp. TaxID=768990 RepID=UPI0025DEF14C
MSGGRRPEGTADTAADAVRIFCSYSHKDEDALDALKDHLAGLRRRRVIADWHDREIRPGADWSAAIDTALNTADIVLLLVSSDFLASDYCNGIELTRALERAAAGEARIIPVYVRPAYTQGEPFERFQGTPEDQKPVYSWSDADAAWVQVVKFIVAAVDDVLAARTLSRQSIPVQTDAEGTANRAGDGAPTAPTRDRGGDAAPTGPPATHAGEGASAAHAGAVSAPARLWIGGGVIAAVVLAAVAGWYLLQPDPDVTRRLADADALLDTGRYDQALAAYETVLDIDAGNRRAAYGRDKAAVLADMGPDFDVEAANRRLRTLEDGHPKDAHIQLMLGRLAGAGQDWEEARRRLERALELDPDLPEARFGLGVLAHRDGRLEAARQHYEQALDGAPGNRRYLTNLAGVLLDLGEHQAALAAYERLLAT